MPRRWLRLRPDRPRRGGRDAGSSRSATSPRGSRPSASDRQEAEMDADMVLDGNALAGVFSELFQHELTIARGTCGDCGRAGPLAETRVYAQAPGAVVRCPGVRRRAARDRQGRRAATGSASTGCADRGRSARRDRPGSAVASGAARARARHARRDPLHLDPLALAARSLGELVEIDARSGGRLRRGSQRLPERELSGDPERERLELVHTLQIGVAARTAVRLEAGEALRRATRSRS